MNIIHRLWLTIVLLCLAGTTGLLAQKSVYIPTEWRSPWPADSLLYADNDPDNRYTWSRSRSIESDNVIVFWEKGYGTTLPSQAPAAYRVDQQDLLQKCEEFYALEVHRLKFMDDTTSNLSRYKLMVMLSHTTDWVCYGGGYDFQIAALWVGPSACRPVGHSVAHEVGHSFQYMSFAEAGGHKDSQTIGTGFHLPIGSGQTIWEQTAQWQANQSYPAEMFNQSIGVFRLSHNLAFTHEWHRYQSYWLLYYLCQHYQDITTLAQVWRQPMTGASDFNQALMRLKGLSADDLYRLYYDYAARCATWDFDVCAPYRDPYVGDLQYRCVALGDTAYQVALSSTPQSTGFNAVPLTVPTGGGTIAVDFTALPMLSKLAPGDPAELLNGNTQLTKSGRSSYLGNAIASRRAFRLGFVALMADGERRYFQRDTLYSQGNLLCTDRLTLDVPADASRLWLIVSPAPRQYTQHLWDNNATSGEESWPYRLHLEGTDLASEAVVYVEPELDGRPVADVTLTYDVYFPPTTGSDHSGTQLTLSGRPLALLATALQLQPTDIANCLQPYATTGPDAGRMMFYPLNTNTMALVARGSTANGYGHWFTATGNVTAYASGYVYSEFTPSTLTFALGQYPGRCAEGSSYTIGQALRYRNADGQEAIARFLFRIHVSNTHPRGALLADMQSTTAIDSPHADVDSHTTAVFDLLGRPVGTASAASHRSPTQRSSARHRAIHITNGRKMLR